MSSMYLPYDLLNDINMASTFSASNSIKSFNTNHNMYINTCNDNSYAKTMNTSQLMSQQDCSELIFPSKYSLMIAYNHTIEYFFHTLMQTHL